MLTYLRTGLIIKRKQFLNFLSANSKSYTKFAIVCAPRCGSTWLHTLLNSHPKIISYGEILRERHESNPNMPLADIDEMVFHSHHSSIGAAGLKLFYEYGDEPVFQKSFREAMEDNLIHIIHLTRVDKIAQFKSLKRAIVTQQWSAGRRTREDIQVSIDHLELKDYQTNLLLKEAYIDELFRHHPLIKIKYEALVSNGKIELASIQKFLNVPTRHLFSLLKKQSV